MPANSVAEQSALDLAEHYSSAGDTEDPVIAQLYPGGNARLAFETCLDRELKILSQRSSHLEKCEISIVQKAYLILCREGKLVQAANLYVREILGVGRNVQPNEETIAAVQAQTYAIFEALKLIDPQIAERILEGTVEDTMEVNNVSAGAEAPSSIDPTEFTRILDLDDTNATMSDIVAGYSATPTSSTNYAPQLARIFSTYHRAKDDLARARPRSFGETRAARFLRDTTENCLNYLKSKSIIPPKSVTTVTGMNTLSEADDLTFLSAGDRTALHDLYASLAHATTIAERGSGGKKRRFDVTNKDRDQQEAEHKPEHEFKHARHFSDPGATTSKLPRTNTNTNTSSTSSTTPKFHPLPARPRPSNAHHDPCVPKWNPRYKLGADYDVHNNDNNKDHSPPPPSGPRSMRTSTYKHRAGHRTTTNLNPNPYRITKHSNMSNSNTAIPAFKSTTAAANHRSSGPIRRVPEVVETRGPCRRLWDSYRPVYSD